MTMMLSDTYNNYLNLSGRKTLTFSGHTLMQTNAPVDYIAAILLLLVITFSLNFEPILDILSLLTP